MHMMDVVQILQFILMLLLAFFVVYTAVRYSKVSGTFVKRVREKTVVFAVIRYMRRLCVVNYECYHKLQVWRFYLFS